MSAPRDPNSKASRRRQALALAHKGQFKVCVGCDRPVAVSRPQCPACHTYRFVDGPEASITAVEAVFKRKSWKQEIL